MHLPNLRPIKKVYSIPRLCFKVSFITKMRKKEVQNQRPAHLNLSKTCISLPACFTNNKHKAGDTTTPSGGSLHPQFRSDLPSQSHQFGPLTFGPQFFHIESRNISLVWCPDVFVFPYTLQFSDAHFQETPNKYSKNPSLPEALFYLLQ